MKYDGQQYKGNENLDAWATYFEYLSTIKPTSECELPSLDQVLKQSPCLRTSPGTQMKRTVSRVTLEMEEKAKRRNNMIILGLKEPNNQLKDDVVRADTEAMLDCFNNVLQVKVEVGDIRDIRDIRRLGRKTTEDETEAGVNP